MYCNKKINPFFFLQKKEELNINHSVILLFNYIIPIFFLYKFAFLNIYLRKKTKLLFLASHASIFENPSWKHIPMY